MKSIKTVALVSLALLALSGCKDESPQKPAAKTATPSAKSAGPREVDVPASATKNATAACADYVAALEGCIQKQDGPQKAAFQKTLDAHKQAWDKAPAATRAQMDVACRTGAASVKQSCP